MGNDDYRSAKEGDRRTIDGSSCLWYRAYLRQREVLFDAPWSSFDIMVSSVVFWTGIFLLFNVGIFTQFNNVYQPLASVLSEHWWGGLFVSLGLYSSAQAVWPVCPPFLVRLTARMGSLFGIGVLFGNALLNSPPPVAVVTYFFITLYAAWGVIRTAPHGK